MIKPKSEHDPLKKKKNLPLWKNGEFTQNQNRKKKKGDKLIIIIIKKKKIFRTILQYELTEQGKHAPLEKTTLELQVKIFGN